MRNQEIGDDHSGDQNKSPRAKKHPCPGAEPGITTEDSDYHIERHAGKDAKNQDLGRSEYDYPRKPNFDEASDSGESSSSGQGSTLTRAGVK